MPGLVVFCADVGSVKRGRFGWARGQPQSDDFLLEDSIEKLVQAVADDLRSGALVALGFECPLFVPLRERPEELTSGRRGDGNRPWSAGAGCAVLAVGLTQVPWILREVRREVRRTLGDVPPSYLRWDQAGRMVRASSCRSVCVGGCQSSTRPAHTGDAELAVRAFLDALPHLERTNAIQEDRVQSLVGAALLRSPKLHQA